MPTEPVDDLSAANKRKLEMLESLNKDLLRNIMILRSLGYQQQEIADRLDVSKQTVWRYLNTLKEAAEKEAKPDEIPDVVFFELFVDMLANKLVKKLLDSEGEFDFADAQSLMQSAE